MRQVLVLVAGITLFGGQAVFAQTQAAATARIASRITVTVPNEETELVVEGKPIGGKGSFRALETPPLEAGTTYRYTLDHHLGAQYLHEDDPHRTVSFRAGDRVDVDMTTERSQRPRAGHLCPDARRHRARDGRVGRRR